MKKNEMSDLVYVDHVLDSIADIELILNSGQRDRIAELAAIRAIEVIGEAANNISGTLRANHQEVPWRQIIDMRNLLIHGYFEVDIKEIWDTCINDIPELKQAIIRIKKELDHAN